MKYDFKKMAAVEFNSTKRPKQVVVPSHSYFEIHGTGNPNDALFPDYIAALYSVAYPTKMAFKKADSSLHGIYTDYTVPPLLGDWTISRVAVDRGAWTKDDFVFRLRMLIPDFVPIALAEKTLLDAKAAGKSKLIDKVDIVTLPEKRVVQMLHVGPYDDEQISFDHIEMFLNEHQLVRTSQNHTEYYLNDARRIAPDRLKTVLEVEVAPR